MIYTYMRWKCPQCFKKQYLYKNGNGPDRSEIEAQAMVWNHRNLLRPVWDVLDIGLTYSIFAVGYFAPFQAKIPPE